MTPRPRRGSRFRRLAIPGLAVLCLAAGRSAPPPEIADVAHILSAVRQPGAAAVLVNVWATWCDPCREEMPDLLRFARDANARGLRLVLVSADDPDEADAVTKFLSASGAASLPPGAARVFIKRGDDTAFVNAIDRGWSGALPASFLYDGKGERRHSFTGPVTYAELKTAFDALVGPPAAGAKPHPTTAKPKGPS
jgi:thiol-disulfide isomerase/thioredoxin